MPAQVHYCWERRLPSMRGVLLFTLFFCAGLGGLFYFTITIIDGPPNWLDLYYLTRFSIFFGVVIALALAILFYPRHRRSEVILILHHSTGASVYFQLHQDGRKILSKHWNHIRAARWEERPHPDGDGTYFLLWCERHNRKPVDLAANGILEMQIFEQAWRDNLAREINRQQDGSWKTQKKVLGDAPELDGDDLGIEPGWDEEAPIAPE